jgi:hypothetical protein
VRVLQDFVLLAEEYCYWNWKTCEGSRVAFHPFKTLQGQWDCYARAETHGDWRTPNNTQPSVLESLGTSPLDTGTSWTTHPKSKAHTWPITASA